MARVTDSDVKSIIDTSLSDLSPYITIANQLVDEFAKDQGYSSSRLTEIERWLAAHFVEQYENNGGLSSATLGDASEGYLTNYESIGLNTSRFGRQVIMLDTKKTMSKIGKKQAKFGVRSGIVE